MDNKRQNIQEDLESFYYATEDSALIEMMRTAAGERNFFRRPQLTEQLLAIERLGDSESAIALKFLEFLYTPRLQTSTAYSTQGVDAYEQEISYTTYS